jgi:hypothetical protein
MTARQRGWPHHPGRMKGSWFENPAQDPTVVLRGDGGHRADSQLSSLNRFYEDIW